MRPDQLFLRSLAILPFIAVLASCQKKEDSAPATELTLRDELTFSIPPTDGTELDLTATYDAQASVNGLLQEKGFSIAQLRDVRIEDARMVMMQPVNAHFDALENVRLDFAQTAGAPLTFAHLDPVPDGQGILELFVEHADLTPFFNAGLQTVHARVTTTAPLGNDTTRVRFALTFRVKAGA